MKRPGDDTIGFSLLMIVIAIISAGPLALTYDYVQIALLNSDLNDAIQQSHCDSVFSNMHVLSSQQAIDEAITILHEWEDINFAYEKGTGLTVKDKEDMLSDINDVSWKCKKLLQKFNH